MLIDSAAILDYLDEQAPDAALIPGSGSARRLATPYACGPTLTHADVMITTLIWYMQDRMDEVLSHTTHADLISLAERCEDLPAFRAAALSDFEKMPRS